MQFRLAAAGLVLLTGCEGGGDTPAVASLGMLNGEIVAAGGDGYCVDPRISRPRDGFALIASCAALSGSGPVPFANGVITVQAGQAGSAAVAGSERALVQFLRSPEGAALLSSDGRAETVRLRDSRGERGIVTVSFDDSLPPVVEGLQDREWRAFVDINGRLVTVSLRGLSTAPLSNEVGNALLGQTVRGLIAANATSGDS